MREETGIGMGRTTRTRGLRMLRRRLGIIKTFKGVKRNLAMVEVVEIMVSLTEVS